MRFHPVDIAEFVKVGFCLAMAVVKWITTHACT